MTYFITDNGRIEGGVNAVAKEATYDCAAITMAMYHKLLEIGEQYAKAYIGFLKGFSDNPGDFIAEYVEEE